MARSSSLATLCGCFLAKSSRATERSFEVSQTSMRVCSQGKAFPPLRSRAVASSRGPSFVMESFSFAPPALRMTAPLRTSHRRSPRRRHARPAPKTLPTASPASFVPASWEPRGRLLRAGPPLGPWVRLMVSKPPQLRAPGHLAVLCSASSSPSLCSQSRVRAHSALPLPPQCSRLFRPQHAAASCCVRVTCWSVWRPLTRLSSTRPGRSLVASPS